MTRALILIAVVLAVGTLTTIPVQPPSVVDRAVAGRAMLLLSLIHISEPTRPY